ncbi:MAG TPA: TfoX/Sxy family protein [Kofleriaceae bacterium]|jgi:TfoX/Sxy family transcriptional regulator of competence genes
MASKQSNVDFVLEQMRGAGAVTARKMFGEYGIYLGPAIIALYCDDELFMKPTDEGRAFITQRGPVKEGPPYPGAKQYFVITGDRCEDGEWLSELARITAAAQPAKKPKAARKPAKKVHLAKSPTKRPAAKKPTAKKGRTKRR